MGSGRAVLAALAGCLLAGCTAADPPADQARAGVSTSGWTSSVSSGSSAPVPPESDAASQTPGTPPPAQSSTVEAPCPYLSTEVVELTVGQRISTTTVTTTTPAPGPLPKCEFQRAGGEPAAIVDTRTVEPGQGLQKSLELVPGGNPVAIGEGGSVLVHKGQSKTELAAYAGTTIVLVTLNQESSLEAGDIAEQVLAQL